MGNELSELSGMVTDLNTRTHWSTMAHWVYLAAFLMLSASTINLYIRSKEWQYMLASSGFILGCIGILYGDYVLYFELGGTTDFKQVGFHQEMSYLMTVAGLAIGAAGYLLVSVRKR